MRSTKKSTIVTIANSRYFMPVFILTLSLKYHKVNAFIKILGVELTDEEKRLLSQFSDTKVFDADLSNQRNPTTRKAEAILCAKDDDVETISLLDADCIVTGDITPYLTKEVTGLSVRVKSAKEDGHNFSAINRYAEDDPYGSIPKSILDVWREDINERKEPRISNTVCGGNLTIKKSCLSFIETWHNQMMSVLPSKRTRFAYDYSDFAYFQMDESVLNSLLAFKNEIPEISEGWFDKDLTAAVAHLGPCRPRYWKFWRKDKLKHYDRVMTFLDWGKENHELPKLTWALNKKNRPFAFMAANTYELKKAFKKSIKQPLTPKR